MTPGAGRAAALATLTLLACHGGLPAGPEAQAEPRIGTRAVSICFAEPRLSPPDAPTRERVLAATRALGGPDAVWIRALMTHESAGIAAAISPTGCAGLLAFATCRGCTPCCIADDRDGADRIYGRCNWERRHGYLCDSERDPRFRPALAVAMAQRKLRALRRRLATADPAGFSFPAALAVDWNAGASSVEAFPSGLTSAVAAVERLRLGDVEPYRSWPGEDRWNKVVELYDYVLWLEALQAAWELPAPVSSRRVDEPARVRCFDVAGDRFVAAPRRPGAYRAVVIDRLRLGRYEPGALEVQERR